MRTRIIISFISSANRQEVKPIINFTIDYPDAILSCRGKEYMELNVFSSEMPNSMYNINDTNNHFEIRIDYSYIIQLYLQNEIIQ